MSSGISPRRRLRRDHSEITFGQTIRNPNGFHSKCVIKSVRFLPGGHRAILVHLSEEDRVAPRGATYRYFIGFINFYEDCGQTRIKNVLFSIGFITKVEDRVAPRGATYRYFICFISVYEGCGQTRIKNVLFSIGFTTKVEPAGAQLLIFQWFCKRL